MNHSKNFVQPDRRPAMTLLCGKADVYSHCCRIVLLEKDIDCTVEYVDPKVDTDRLGEHNPYAEVPTLIDRDVAVYGINVLLDYLDERFPHPPLMPVDPIMRAKTRLTVARFNRDWFIPISELEEASGAILTKELRENIQDGLVALSQLFTQNTWFMGDEFSIVDCYLAPLLWRLEVMGIVMPKQASPLEKYSERLFERSAFVKSLSDVEREMRL